MSDDGSQITVPPSFVALFVPPGRSKPTAARETIAARYDLCEDMAQMLCEPARTQVWELGVTETDVLQRMRQGLAAATLGMEPAEADWVIQRLAELLDWPRPAEPG